MKVIHLCFQLHTPYELVDLAKKSKTKLVKQGSATEDTELEDAEKQSYFASEASFARADRKVYQPFFALLERNIQKYQGLHFSLIVSGAWLELAEAYRPELIERLKKMVKQNRVELVAVPYYHSLAFFYNKEELTEQVQIYQSEIERLFGVTGRILAMPELIYNDAIGKWAEDFGFAGMLVGGSARALGWKSANHVYEAVGCEYLRLLVRNAGLSDLIGQADSSLLVEKKVDETPKEVLSAVKVRKKLDLEFLRGNLVNLYFDAQMFEQQRAAGIIGFFDDLIANWLENEQNKFVTAAEACMVEKPTQELAIKQTVSWRGDAEEDAQASKNQNTSKLAGGLVLKADIENKLPRWLARKDQQAVAELVYGLRRQVLASENEEILADFQRLTLVDYQKGINSTLQAKLEAIVDDLKQRIEDVKRSQAVEISRAFTKKRDRGEVNRPLDDAPRPKGAVRIAVVEDADYVVPVQRADKTEEDGTVLIDFDAEFGGAANSGVGADANVGVVSGSETSENVEMGADDGADADDVNDNGMNSGDRVDDGADEIKVVRKITNQRKPKTHAVRKIIKKLVIE